MSHAALASSLDWAIRTGLQGTSQRFPSVGVTFAGQNLSDFWEMVEKSPMINYTFTSSLSGVLGECTPPNAYSGDPHLTGEQMQSWGILFSSCIKNQMISPLKIIFWNMLQKTFWQLWILPTAKSNQS